jgi:hypothetical protein
MTDLTREQMLRQEAALRQIQARGDDALSTWNVRAPAPVSDATVEYGERYERKMLRTARDHLPTDHPLYITGIDKNMPMDVVRVWAPQIYAACKAAGASNDSAPPGEMRMVTRVDPHTGFKENVWYGKESFVKEFTRPGRRVLSFRTDHGYVNSRGFPLR